MHIDTYRQGWQAFKRCSFVRDSWPKPERGRLVLIDLFEGDGVCAKVEWGEYKIDQWYVYKGGHITKLASRPTGKPLGLVPPGCSPL